MIKNFLLLLLSAQFLFSYPVTGRVVDEKSQSPLEGVVVTLSNSDEVLRTNSFGEFSFNLNPKQILDTLSGKVLYRLHYTQNKQLLVTGGEGEVDLRIHNLSGRVLLDRKFTLGQSAEISTLSPGVYLYSMKLPYGEVMSGKIGLVGRGSVVNLGSGTGVVIRSAEQSDPVEINILSRTHHCKRVIVDNQSDLTISLKKDSTAELFNDTIMRSYNLEISEQTLQDMETYWDSEEYQKAQIYVDGESLGDIGVRYKGSHGLKICFDENNNKICRKVSLKFKFDRFDPVGELYGVTRLNLHSLNEDPSKLHDKIGYEQFHDMGIYSSRTAYCKLYINGDFHGVYLAVEQVDENFLKSRFSEYDQGNLFKSVWPGHSEEEKLLNNLKTNTYTPNLEGFKAFGEAIGSGDFSDELEDMLDLDYMMRYVAVDRAIINWDGIMTWYWSSSKGRSSNHNFYWYESEYPKKRFTLIPWDLDECMVRPGYVHEQCNIPTWTEGEDCKIYPFWLTDSLTVPGNDPFIRGLSQHHFDKYLKYSRDILEYGFNEDTLTNRITRYTELIRTAYREDPNAVYTAWNSAAKAFKYSVPYYRTRLEKLISSYTPAKPDPVEDEELTPHVIEGISAEYVNGFEHETQENLESWLTGRATSPSRTKAYINEVNPMSGEKDLLLQTIFRYSKREQWLSSYYKLHLIDGPIDLKEYRYFTFQLRSDFARPISVNFEGAGSYSNWKNLPGKSYMIFQDPVDIVIDLETIYYQPWENFTKPIDYVVEKTNGVSFEVDLNYNEYFYDTDKIDTCNIYIDNIRFVK